MRQTVTIEIDVELFAEVDDDGLTVIAYRVEDLDTHKMIGEFVVQEAIDNAHPGEWE